MRRWTVAAEPSLERVRVDALPENIVYRDEGCSVAPRCLECPLPLCRYDVHGGVRAIRHAVRNPRIHALRRSGAPIGEIAARFGIGRREVFRILAMDAESFQLRPVAFSSGGAFA